MAAPVIFGTYITAKAYAQEPDGEVATLGIIDTDNGNETAEVIDTLEEEEQEDSTTQPPLTAAQPIGPQPPIANATALNATALNTTSVYAIIAASTEEPIPYACFSDTNTCYCDGSADCDKLAASGKCEGEVKDGPKPGVGECEWKEG